MTALLEARNVTKVFGSGGLFKRKETVALENMNLLIRGSPPSITGVVGESGSGKTTLVRLLLGLLSPTEGEVLYKGRDLQKMSGDERLEFQREVQVIFQDPFEVYNPFYKVDHVLTTPVTKFHLARSKSEAQELIEHALKMIGLRPEETLGRYPHQMSGGQRQRVMVARASLLRPRIILADEPVSMVDASLRATILESLRDAELLIKNPQHSYTRLLVESIPLSDPDRRWGQDSAAVLVSKTSTKLNQGCKFADRCPFVMSICRKNLPPLYQTDRYRAVRCFLYKDSPVIPGDEIGNVFVKKG